MSLPSPLSTGPVALLSLFLQAQSWCGHSLLPGASRDENWKPERSHSPQTGVRLPKVSDDDILGFGPVSILPHPQLP